MIWWEKIIEGRSQSRYLENSWSDLYLDHINTIKQSLISLNNSYFSMSNCSFLRKNLTTLQKESLSPFYWVELTFPLPDQSRAHPLIGLPPKQSSFTFSHFYYKWMHTTYLEGEKQPLSPHQCALKRISKGRYHRSCYLFTVW